MEDSSWKNISETLGEVKRNEMLQMYVLPLECDFNQPAIHRVNSNDYTRANHRRHTRRAHNAPTTIDQSEGWYCISYCHFRTRGSSIALNIVLLAVLILICTVVALLILTYNQRPQLRVTTNISAEIEVIQKDITITLDHHTESTSSSSATHYTPQETEHMDLKTEETTLQPETEVSTATILPTTPLEITQETGCLSIPIMTCRKHLPYSTTFFPNRFGLGQTATEGANLYYQFSIALGARCHPDAKRLMCRILFSPCYQPLTSTDPVPLPCRSLCEDVGARCVKDRVFNDTWNEICNTMPESRSEAVCFRNSLISNQDIPQECSDSPCYNSGTCLEVNGQTICRCSDRFYGITCQNEFEDPCSGNPCVNGGTCEEQRSPFGFSFYICHCLSSYHGARCEQVIGTPSVGHRPTALAPPGSMSVKCQAIPAECQSVLSYNRSTGILVGPDTAFFSPWPLIETYIACSPRAAQVLFCSTVYPTCSQDHHSPTYGQPCREVCEQVKNDCEYTYETLNLPYIQCNHLQYRNSSMGLSCLDFR